MSEPNFSQSQSVSISNSQVSGQIGMARQNLSQTQVNQMIASEALTSEDAIRLMVQIEEIVQVSSLPEAQKQKAMHYLGSAKEEAQQPEPDKDFAAKSLKRATEVIKNANEALSAGQGVFEKVKPVVEKLLPWFGVVKGFFGL